MVRSIAAGLSALAIALPAIAEDTPALATCPENAEQVLSDMYDYLRGTPEASEISQHFDTLGAFEESCANDPVILGRVAFNYATMGSIMASQEARGLMLDQSFYLAAQQDQLIDEEDEAQRRMGSQVNFLMREYIMKELTRLYTNGYVSLPYEGEAENIFSTTCPWVDRPADRSRAVAEAQGLLNAVKADIDAAPVKSVTYRLEGLYKTCRSVAPDIAWIYALTLSEYAEAALADGNTEAQQQYAEWSIDLVQNMLDQKGRITLPDIVLAEGESHIEAMRSGYLAAE